jgi:hypothetical protein
MRCACLTAVVVSGIVLMGCGGGGESDDRGDVENAVKLYLAGLSGGGDPVRACEQMTPDARKQTVETVTAAFPDGGDLPCAEALRDLGADLEPAVRQAVRAPEVTQVELDGDRGTVTVTGVERPVVVARVDDEWRVARGVAR